MLNLTEIWMAGTRETKGDDASYLSGSKDAAKFPQIERIAMAGMFELFMDAESAYRFRLTAPDGTIMAVSKPFNTKSDAVAGIAAVREYAGMGLITDQCTKSTNAAVPSAWSDTGGQAEDSLRMPKIDFHGRASAVRRAVSGPRWAGAIHNLS